MKKIYMLAISLGMAFLGYSQTYISEDFSNFMGGNPPLNSGWKNVDSLNNPVQPDSLWRFDNPGNRTLNTPITGTAAIIDSDFYGSGNSQDAYLQSPNFNASAATTVTMEFDHYHRALNNIADLEVFDGTSWVIVASYGAGTTDPAHEVVDLTPYVAGVSNAQVRFHYTGNYSWYWILDNVSIFQPIPDDVAAISVDSLVNGCGLSSAETVALRFTNVGSTPVQNIPVQYSVNGGTVVSEIYTDTVQPGDTAIHSFTTKANFSTVGTYTITANTSLRGDANPINDSATGTVVNIPILSTFPYYEDFEQGNGGWTSGGTNNTWALGTPANTVINSASSGTNAWVTNLSGQYSANEQSFVQGPCFDFTNLSAPQFKMNIWWESEANWDGAVLQTSIDGGSTWQAVGSFGDPNNWYNMANLNAQPGGNSEGWGGRNSSGNGSGGWVLAEHDLTGLGGISGVLLRIAFAGDGSIQDEGFAFDNVLVQDAPAVDAGLVSIDGLVSGCGLGIDSIHVTIANFGSTPIFGIPVGYDINSGTPVNETYTDTIFPGDTAFHTFQTTANFSVPGTYTVNAYVSLTGDASVLNDSTSTTITHFAAGTISYTENFDALATGTNSGFLANNWFISNSGGHTWITNSGGTPSSGTGPLSDASSSGVYLFTETSGSSVGSITELTSSCLDFGSGTRGGITLEYKYHMFGATMGTLNTYIDSMGTWVLVDSIVGQQQTAQSDPWLQRSVSLNSFVNLGPTALRFEAISGGSYTGDISLDEIRIYEPTSADVGVISIDSLTSGCGLGNETICVSIKNFGTASISNFPVSYSINSATATVETITATILPGDTLVHCFTTQANFSTPGNYTIDAFTSANGDGDANNDSSNLTIVNIPILSNFPYNEGFENGNGGWIAGGANSSWALGTPAGSVINSAATGTQAWVTGISSQYNANEQSFVQGPCFDFTNLAAPQIKMNVWWESEANWDGAVLQTSIDGGTTWQNVGAFADPNNWFNMANLNAQPGGSAEGWGGRNSSANGSAGWLLAEHDLNGLGGISGVLIRVAFAGDGSVQDEGFSFDDVVIQDAPASDVGLIGFVSPSDGGCTASAADSVRVLIANFGSSASVGFPVSYEFNGGTPVTETVNDTLFPGDTLMHTFSTTVNVGTQGSTYTFDGYTALVGDGNLLNDSIIGYTVTNNATFATYPYFENFDGLTSGASGSFINGWTGTNNGAFEWRSNSGGTSSGATGPTGDHTTGSGIYMYTEASSPAALGETASLTSPCIDLSTHTSSVLTLSYWYHMYGADIQTLFVEVDSMGTWVIADTIIGQQQTTNADPFQFRMASLDNFASLPYLKLRFRTLRGASFNGDVAIDDVAINANSVGIENEDLTSNTFKLFPNPSNGEFTLVLPQDLNNINLEIRDISGKLVSEEFVNNSSSAIQFDLSNLSKGIYFIKAFNEAYSKTEKLIVK